MASNPMASDVHVNAPLTNVSAAYIQGDDSYIADKAFPNVPVQKQSDVIFTYSKDDLLRDEMQLRGPATESAGDGYRIDHNKTYFANVWALHRDIDDFQRVNADQPLDMDRDATIFLTQRGMIRREKFWVSKYFTTSIWAGGPSAGDWLGTAGASDATHKKQWDLPGSTPIEDVKQQLDNMQEQTSYRPNVLVLGARVFTSLTDNAEFLDRVKYGGGPGNPADVDAIALAKVFGVKQVLIARATSNTAAELATGTYSFIAGSNALLLYRPDAPSIMTPSAGYTYSWNGYFGASELGLRMNRFRMQHLKADRVEIEMAFDMATVSTDLGCFYSAITSV